MLAGRLTAWCRLHHIELHDVELHLVELHLVEPYRRRECSSNKKAASIKSSRQTDSRHKQRNAHRSNRLNRSNVQLTNDGYLSPRTVTFEPEKLSAKCSIFLKSPDELDRAFYPTIDLTIDQHRTCISSVRAITVEVTSGAVHTFAYETVADYEEM